MSTFGSIITLAALAGVIIANEPGAYNLMPGAVKENLGKVYPITRLCEIQYDTSPISRFNKILNMQSRNLTHIKNFIDIDPSLTREHADSLTQSLNILIQRIKSFTHIHTNNTENTRARRGLFNFVGVLSNALFGTVDEYSLSNRLLEYDDKIQSVAHSFQSNAAAFKALTHNTEQLQLAYTTLKGTATNISHNLDSLTRFVDINTILTQYKDSLNDITLAAGIFQRDIIAAVRGSVYPSLISPTDIQPVIHELLTQHNEIPLYQPSNLPSFYATLSSYITPAGLSIILPLHPDIILSAYGIHPFPFHDNISNTFITTKAPELLLTTPTNKLLSAPKREVLQSCMSPSPFSFVCLQPAWAYIPTTDSCAPALLTNDTNITRLCSFNELAPSSTPFMLPLVDVTLLYYYSPTPITVTCNSQLPMLMIQGPYSLPHKCKLQSISFSLPKLKHYTITLTAKPHYILPYQLAPMNLSRYNESLNITFLPIPELDYPNYTQFTHYFTTYAYPIIVTSSIIAFLLLAIGLHSLVSRNRYIHTNIQSGESEQKQY